MTFEDQILCLLARQNFNSQHHEQLLRLGLSRVIDWEDLFETAEQQQVAPLVYTNLSKFTTDDLEVPQTVLSKFKKAYIHNVFVKGGTAEIMEQVLALFAQKSIDVMLVKGAALNVLVYDQPWYVVSYDVDLVIRAWPDDIDPADHAEIVETLEAFNHHPNRFKEHIEYDYYEHHDVTMSTVFAVDFDRLWAEARKIELGGQAVWVSPPEDMLIMAAIQSCRKRFFRLKALCDIASIIEKYPTLDWNVVISKAQAYKCDTIMYTALLIAQRLLECSLPKNVLDDLHVNPVRAAIIRHLVARLYHSFSLTELFNRSDTTFLGREFSWSLLLTYASYRFDRLIPKLGEIYGAWRNPPPPVPG